MKELYLLATSALLGLTVAASSSASTLGLLKADGVSLGDWETAYEKAAAFVGNLTTDQKLALITGSSVTAAATNKTFSALTFSDGDMGLQDYYYVSAFSLASALAMSWDREVFYQQAKAVGTEFYKKGQQVINGPTSQPLGRTPWGGRIGEAFGPDPYLNGLATGLTVKGYVEAGVIAGAKHFLLNEQETNRTANSSSLSPNPESGPLPYSSNTDDKTLHEAYLWSFYDAVKNGLGAVMCAMTKVNNTLSCENNDLLMKHLKTEMGFPGMVYADTKAQSGAIESALNGEDYGSNSIWTTSLMKAILANGTLSEERLDDMAIRNTIGYYFSHLDNGQQPAQQSEGAFVDVRGNHSKLIRQHGAQSIVLLKNERNALPLKTVRKMAIFGAHAGSMTAGPNGAISIDGSGPTYQGHLATGSGSGQASYPYLVTPMVPLTLKAIEDGTILDWILQDNYTESAASSQIQPQADSTFVNPSYVNHASSADVCLVFLNALAGEGKDRTELYNADQDKMVQTVADNCNNTIVVINTVGPRLLDHWAEHTNVTAVLYSSLLGQESGNSIVDVLYGDVNPSGHLTYTIAKNESDYPVKLCYTSQCNFTEGVYLDYRHFDAYNIIPRYPFGHGLSYTTFDYANLTTTSASSSISLSRAPTGHRAVGGYSDLWDTVHSISVTVRNTGAVVGAATSQLYLGFPVAADQPVRQLRGFERVQLAPGRQATVHFPLRRRDISYWDVTAQQWLVAAGQYQVYVGASSRDLQLNGTFTVQTHH
ncbi:putative beta-glucosidase D [Aspergillus japonicus CBS 114.51]|uniref:beta-glucosidase n=1 Tax=Aspergillus japonicus CBS 114.51 TaxID=1448312 RepID=A0A8T8WP74_ASPJA|nr:putative beta-glucosidase D [Aspergillus japonicus CBS 114.51]RAH77189.1 putative beta-glucosidase D [Aspergillus japonicus CBS 114.51]